MSLFYADHTRGRFCTLRYVRLLFRRDHGDTASCHPFSRSYDRSIAHTGDDQVRSIQIPDQGVKVFSDQRKKDLTYGNTRLFSKLGNVNTFEESKHGQQPGCP